jgi:YVTN family beta-propeller protein
MRPDRVYLYVACTPDDYVAIIDLRTLTVTGRIQAEDQPDGLDGFQTRATSSEGGRMINKKELAICKKRGHKASLLGDGWAQCKWCGMWLREVTKIEQRDDAPPKETNSPSIMSDSFLSVALRARSASTMVFILVA